MEMNGRFSIKDKMIQNKIVFVLYLDNKVFSEHSTYKAAEEDALCRGKDLCSNTPRFGATYN